MTGRYDPGFESSAEIPPCDYEEIILVYLGKLGDKELTTVGLLNTIFAKQINKEERTRRIREDYKIDLDESIFDEVEELMVNLDEDYKKYMARIGKEEERAKTVSILASNVEFTMKHEAVTFDDAFKRTGFPEEYREEVRAKVESESA